MPVVSTAPVDSAVPVTPVSVVMELHARMLTNVTPVPTPVTPTQNARTAKDHSTANADLDSKDSKTSKETVTLARMLMNAKLERPTVMTKPHAPTPTEDSHAHAKPDSKEMESLATMSTNVQLELTTATPTQHAPTLKEDSHASVTPDSRETEKHARTSTNARVTPTTAIRTPTVTTSQVVSRARAKPDSPETDKAVKMLTNVPMVPMTVTITPLAPTLSVASTANAELLPTTSRTSMETDVTVRTATNAKPRQTTAIDRLPALIPMVDSLAHVRPVSLVTVSLASRPQPLQLPPPPRQQPPPLLEPVNLDPPTTATPRPHVLTMMMVHLHANVRAHLSVTVPSVRNHQSPPPPRNQNQQPWLELVNLDPPTTATAKPPVPITMMVHSHVLAKETSSVTVPSAENQPPPTNQPLVDQVQAQMAKKVEE
jgi:hypothetical protein